MTTRGSFPGESYFIFDGRKKKKESGVSIDLNDCFLMTKVLRDVFCLIRNLRKNVKFQRIIV